MEQRLALNAIHFREYVLESRVQLDPEARLFVWRHLRFQQSVLDLISIDRLRIQ